MNKLMVFNDIHLRHFLIHMHYWYISSGNKVKVMNLFFDSKNKKAKG